MVVQGSSIGRSMLTPTQLWSADTSLSPRVKKLRDQFWSFYERSYTNEVRGYTTGTPWDCVYSIWSWTNVPEVALFQQGFRSYLLAGATPVDLPKGFWEEPLPVRQALFFRETLRNYLLVEVLEGELVVGSHFSTALSRCLKKDEAKQRDRQEAIFLKEWHALNDTGVGNCAAVPGHLVPDYPKALRLGWKGLQAEAKAVVDSRTSSPEQRDLGRAIMIAADAVHILMERYVAEIQRQAAVETSPERRFELIEMARICAKVPWLPPETFPEA